MIVCITIKAGNAPNLKFESSIDRRGPEFLETKKIKSKETLSGFYDWLRASDGEIIGVRYWLEAWEVQRIGDLRWDSRFVEITPSCIQIFFSSSRGFDNPISQDQEFGQSGICALDDETVRFFFETSLSEGEFLTKI
ncbi:hypothetical protein [Polaromonas sp. LjRoot131]|jgi:hypothetical protein|uniref:hypothetical protein n=1 Tax=Polaromonas sp. LjRoot131 TaxID=3342262 RepID=UPI003ED006AA